MMDTQPVQVAEPEGQPEAAVSQGAIEPESVIRLRDDPPRVMRLSRKAIASAAAIGSGLLAGTLIYALLPETSQPVQELHNIGGVAIPEALTRAPEDYAIVPKLGPPLPGDLGKPILDAQGRPQLASLPPPENLPTPAPTQLAPVQVHRDTAGQERDAARASRLFFEGRGQSQASTAPPPQTAGPARADPVGESLAPASFPPPLKDRPGPPASTVLQAGSVIAAALITGIKSDVPGLVTAQVTENVYDSATGRRLLIPQGARLIGEYRSEISFGQNRVQLAWTRLILPGGRSIALDLQPAADAAGYSGLADKTDYHWAGVFKAALVSTLLGAGAEFGTGNDNNLARAFRRGSQDSINRAGEQIVARELNVRPTLTIRPGYPVRVMVTRDIVLGDTQ